MYIYSDDTIYDRCTNFGEILFEVYSGDYSASFLIAFLNW